MLRTQIAKLERLLGGADYRGATALVEKIRYGQSMTRLKSLRGGTGFKMRASAAIAEVLFYNAENDAARELIEDAAKNQGKWTDFGLDLPARARLQLVEHDYSARSFEAARMAARTIRNQCHDRGDYLGAAEAAYYMARCYMRLHDPDPVYRACDRALEWLSLAGNQATVHWRTGLVLLVAGSTGSEAGHSAWLELYAAKAILNMFPGDIVGRANVEHAIGSAFRRAESKDANRALKAFDKALVDYRQADHKLNIARVETNIGRTYLNTHDWQNAQRHFDVALETSQGISDRRARARQRAETWICKAWLHRESDERDVRRARECAQEALKEVKTAQQAEDRGRALPGRLTVEAQITLGDCDLDDGNVMSAQKNYDEALRLATDRGINKLRARVYLALAELHAWHATVEMARTNYRKAEELIPVASDYLREKAKKIDEKIKFRSDTWLITKERVLGEGFAAAKAGFEKWFVERMKENPGTLKEKAKLAGLKTPAGFYKFQKRHMGTGVS
jgi:tetratricopeptide (TPR) repeat protein